MRRFIISFFLLSLMNTAVCRAVTGADDDSIARQRRFEYFYMQALAMREQGELASAFEMLEHCRAVYPCSPSVLYELTPFYITLGRKDYAMELMQSAIKSEPDNFWYYHALAALYQETGRIEDAINLYDSMTKRFSSHSEIYIYLAELYDNSGQYLRAIETLDNLEKTEGKSEALSQQKFRLYMLLQDEENSLRELRELADEYPEDLSYRVALGDVYLRFGDTDSAYSIYMDVLAEDSDNLLAQSSLVDYYIAVEEEELYIKSMEQFLMNEKLDGESRVRTLVGYVKSRQNSDSTGYCIDLFERLMKLPYGQAEVADVYAGFLISNNSSEERVVPVLKRLLQLEPENYLAQMQLLRYAIDHRNFEEIVSRCDSAILYNPELLALYYYRGIACYNLRRSAEALETYREGLEKRSDDTDPSLISDVFTLIGDTEHELGHMRGCYEAYDSALVYDNDNIAVLNNYAYFLSLESCDLERAFEMSHKTVQAEPDNVTYIDTYAWILFCLERYEEARAYAEKLISLSSDEDINAVLCSHIGDIYAKCGDVEKAVQYWTMAQKLGDESKILKLKIKKRKYIPDEKNK